MEIGPKEHANINGNIGIWDRDIVFDDRLGFGIWDIGLLALFGPGILLRLFSLVISCVLTCFYRQLVLEHQR
jgi:hypothetical protein